ncbi:hypothetical protein D7V97_31250, partial [Corallococcus sp. CA053C]|uniref:hypothetical protein n=1 Tax=Corallococcus sp. CA053C TaxID=2316732 RepID=UPI000EC9165C
EAPRRQAPVVDERPTDTRPIPVRTKTHDTLAGYNVDISAALKAAELKDRERELANAKRKNPKKPAKVAVFSLPRLWPVPAPYRFWFMLGVVALACGLGFGVMWIILGASGA